MEKQVIGWQLDALVPLWGSFMINVVLPGTNQPRWVHAVISPLIAYIPQSRRFSYEHRSLIHLQFKPSIYNRELVMRKFGSMSARELKQLVSGSG